MKYERGNMKEEEIKNLISNSRRDYDKQAQKAELLLRNTKFGKDFKEISSELCDNFFKMLKEYASLSEGATTQAEEAKKAEEYLDKHPDFYRSWDEWCIFCPQWSISPGWDGNSSSLKKFLKTAPFVSFTQISDMEDAILYIVIDAWTTSDDLKDLWPEVKKAQELCFPKKIKTKSNFGRDLCWYDLNKKHKLSPRKISELWEKHCPEDTDLSVIKYIMQNDEDTMKEIKVYIKKMGFKDLDDKKIKDDVLLKEIKEGKLKKFRENFDYNKEYYVEGKHGEKKLIPPFIGMIKEAIKRIEKFMHTAEVTWVFNYLKAIEKDFDFFTT